MNSREHSDMPPAPSYPSPDAAQMAQGTMQYYNRQLTADELLSAELSREAAGANLADGSSNGLHHGQSMVLGSSNPGPSEMGHPSSADQQHGMLPFTPNQQAGVDPNHDLSYGDQSARRKRSKVSRACDECRRKKVRCDATSVSGVETCSNCKRLRITCQYSRVPLKRGPSKGYIKELAERLNTLESQIQPSMGHHDMQYQQMNEAASPRGYHEFSPQVETGLLSRKRTYSMSEGLPSSTFTHSAFDPRVQQSSVGESNPSLPDNYNPLVVNGATNKVNSPFWTSAHQDHSQPANTELTDVSKSATAEDTSPAQVDDGALDAYYQFIHPFLPFLPNTKDRLLELLYQCKREVQEVFLHSFYAVTHTDISRVGSSFQNFISLENAQELVSLRLRENPMLRSNAANFIWLQSLLFMLLDCDARGPDNLWAKNGLPKSMLVEAVAKLGFHIAKSFDQLMVQDGNFQDLDSDAGLARRGWVVASTLCRWHTFGVAERDVIGSYEIGNLADQKVLGLASAQLAAYATFLPTLLEIVANSEKASVSDSGVTRLLKCSLFSQLNRLNDIERAHSHATDELIPRSYFETLGPQVFWTVNLLVRRHMFVYTPLEVIYAAEAVVKEMLKKTTTNRLPSPFDVHSLCIATLTLLEATDMPIFACHCWEVLDKVDKILDAREKATAKAGEFDNIFATPAWDRRIRSSLERKRNKDQFGQSHSISRTNSVYPLVGPNEQRSLQHLADLAVGAEGVVASASSPPLISENHIAAAASGAGSTGPQSRQRFVDFTRLTKYGYLNVFGHPKSAT